MDARTVARAGGDPAPRQANLMGGVEWLLLVTLSVLWGGSFFFSKVALEELPPFTVVLGRVALAAVALNLIVVASGQRMPGEPRRWGAFLAMGALNNMIPFSLIFWGQTQIASGLASIFVTFSSAGQYYVRRQANPTSVNANSGWGAIERYDVR